MIDSTNSNSSLFVNHLLVSQMSRDKIHIARYDFLPAIVLVLLLILFVWVFHTNRKKVEQIIKGFYSNRYSNQLAREEVSFGNRVSVFLFLLFILSTSLFINKLSEYIGFRWFTDMVALRFATIVVSLFLIYLIKIAIVNIFGSLFEQKKLASDYNLILMLFCNSLGVFLFPIVILLAFAKKIQVDYIYISGVGLIGLFVVVRLIRGTILSLRQVGTSVTYIFLYLCALEILPFVILYKTITLML